MSFFADVRDQLVPVRRPLDQHAVGLELLQRAQHRPRRAGAVVADAEDVEVASSGIAYRGSL